MKKLLFFVLLNVYFIGAQAQVANPIDYYFECQDPYTGTGIVFLETFDLQILGAQNPANFTVFYYDTLADAEANTNQIVSNFPYGVGSTAQIIYARVIENLTGNLSNIINFSLIVAELPPDPGPLELNSCDDDASGSPVDEISIFDLTTMDPIATGGNPQFMVTWFESILNEQSDIPISDPSNYVNMSNPQTVIARIQDNSSPCKIITTLTLGVIAIPSPNLNPVPLEICDEDNNGIGVFDLTTKDAEILDGELGASVVYYETLTGAEEGNPSNALASPYENIVPFLQTIYARVTKDSPPSVLPCYAVVALDLIVNEKPLSPDIGFLEVIIAEDLDGNGLEAFDLTVNDLPILGSQNPSDFEPISYYTSLSDAELGQNPIATPGNFMTDGQTVFGKIQNLFTGCYRITPFELVVIGVPLTGNPPLIFIDEGDGDGQAIFDLTLNESIILEGLDTSLHSVSYYESFSDSNNTLNPINNPTAYQNTSNPQTIYVRVMNTNTNGYGLTQFDIETDGVLGIQSNAFSDLTMYPNPVQNEVTLTSGGFTSEVKVQVYNMSGKVIYVEKILPSQGKCNLNLKGLPSGMYFIEISSEGKTTVQKLLKQ